MAYLRIVGGFLLLAVLFCLRPVWAMEIYSFVDESGVVHLTDRPNDSRYRPVNFGKHRRKKPQANKHWPVVSVPVVNRARVSLRGAHDREWTSLRRPIQQPLKRRRNRFEGIIFDAAQLNGLNSALLRSVIRAESGFDPNATSAKGAVGLMQLMPATARMYGVQDSTDPEANIHGGARFLAALLRQFDNDLELSLAAYNAGPAAVAKYGRTIPPYPETQLYVARVLRYYREYRQIM